MALHLLLVEDDDAVRDSLAGALEEEGVRVVTAPSAEAALARLGESPPEVILSDIRMPGLDGIELLELVRERAPGIDVILMTAYEDMPTVARAMREGAFEFLVKPLRTPQLLEVLQRVEADRAARLRESAEDKHASLPEDGPVEDEAEGGGIATLVGRHSTMIEVYKRIGKVAASRVNVLLLGETGTGKERVARAIHHHSADAEEPFIAVNCAALPDTLLESELFGHVKGAFTGAVADRRGRFALAGRGTILLDEIGDTSAAFQGKLLRVLEEGEFYRVGAEKPEHTEARVIAATHRDLRELVKEGRFREDLYYRLHGVGIRVPPLRERLSDLPLLARHFVRRAARKRAAPEPFLPDETLEFLLAYRWPGNVRELENCLTRAVVLTTGDVIRPEHLGLGDEGEGNGEVDGLSLESAERAQLQRALTSSNGNRSRAAEILGVSRTRLYRMLDKYDLD
jgi:DNA-binding NtrC family response regulator